MHHTSKSNSLFIMAKSSFYKINDYAGYKQQH